MAKDISEELYAKIKESFDRKYEKAQLLGEPLHDVFARIQSGAATFQDADMYAVEVGSMISDSLKEHIKLDELPNKTFYRNIAKKTLGESLKDSYGMVSNIAAVIQEEMNEAAGIGLKAVKPKLEGKAVDDIVNRASAVKTQEELDGVLTEPVKTFTRRVADDSMKANARLHNKAGLEVKVEREYDGVGLHDGTDVCDWCFQRAGTWTYDKAMANGVFERHEGCGCIIDYTSKKGERSRGTGAKSEEGKRTKSWDWEKRLERKKIADRIHQEAEESNKRRKALNQETLVDMNKIKSPSFLKKISKIDEDKKVCRECFSKIKETLGHRSGTEFEDLTYIDITSSKGLINKAFDKIRSCKPSKKMEEMRKAAKPGDIIGLHNHPSSSPPSWSDIMAAKDRNYKYGIVIGHDGTIYKYSINEKFNEVNAYINIDKANKIFYNQGVKSIEFEEVKEELLKNGVILEVI